MYGDSEVIRRQAGRLREQGQDIRALAEQVVAQAESVAWSGRAADAMRERVREHATRLRQSAEGHDLAASSLEAHLVQVEELKDSIADVERRARSLLEDGVLAGVETPVPGHKDWLAVGLPGPDDRQSGG